MSTWSKVWLFLHVLSAIVAFGPTFVFGPLAGMIRANPQHAVFGAKVSNMIETKIVMPAAALVPLFGAALIFSRRLEFWKSTWLLIAAGVYTINYAFAFFVQRPTGHKIVEKVEALAAGTGGPETIQELEGLGKKAMRGGIFLLVLFLVVLSMMIFKPGNCFVGQATC